MLLAVLLQCWRGVGVYVDRNADGNKGSVVIVVTIIVVVFDVSLYRDGSFNICGLLISLAVFFSN